MPALKTNFFFMGKSVNQTISSANERERPQTTINCNCLRLCISKEHYAKICEVWSVFMGEIFLRDIFF